MYESIKIASVNVDAVDGDVILREMQKCIETGDKGFFAYVNAHAVNLSQKYKWFKDVLNNSTISYADGQGIRLAAWLLGLPVPPLVNLTHWGSDLLKFAESKQYTVFLLGSHKNILNKATIKIKETFPDLNIVGNHHGYFQKDDKETENILRMINAVKPNILIVGMGMTKQEKWIYENIPFLKANAIFSAGNYIDILAGVKKICPKWISNIGLEWLFRLIQDPMRLSIRYLFGNPKFLFYILTRKN